MPVFRYLHAADRLDDLSDPGALDVELARVVTRIRRLNVPEQNRRRFLQQKIGDLRSPLAVMATSLADYFKLDSLLLLDPEGYDLDDLREALLQYWNEKGEAGVASHFWRALCYYDARAWGGDSALIGLKR